MQPELQCPRCEKALYNEPYEGVLVDICADCAGVWLDTGELKHILESREQEFTPEQIAEVKGVSNRHYGRNEDQVGELFCPRCSAIMTRFNYASTTGIMLDKCNEHGIWFDKGELEAVQICTEHWERKVNERNSRLGVGIQNIQKARASSRPKAAKQEKSSSEQSSLLKFVLGALDFGILKKK